MPNRAVHEPRCACHAQERVFAQKTIPNVNLETTTSRRSFAPTGRSAQRAEHRTRSAHLAVRFTDHVPVELLTRTLEIEWECCSFFDLDYHPASHELTITVHANED